MTIRIFNVLGREKQDFVPLEAGRVGMYVCGPTVQEYSHLGHAKTYVSFDMIVRYLRYTGLDVLYVQNITDVGHLLESGEDRILKKASQLQAKPMAIVEKYAREYFADMDALGVVRPDISPRASGHVPEQIQMIQTLIAKGFAYESEGSVYFDVTKDPDYGKLSNRRLDMQEAGSREEIRSDKRNPEDFALWKRAEPEHIMRWDSPWGEGFPGWHIECSAMARKYLGPTFDIHGGGIDNIFPHNECEIAQSESANESDFARYWMLVGTLNVPDRDGIPTKMSKSLGNFVTIRQALERYRPEVIRMFAFSAHYSNPITYSDEVMTGAQGGWERLNNAVRLTRQMMGSAPDGDDGNAFTARLDQARQQFREVMDDDFNAPLAIAALQELTRDVNTLLNGDAAVGLNTLKSIDDFYTETAGNVLGLIPSAESSTANAQREAGLVQLLIDLRARARKEKNFAESDRIRNELAALGVTLEDRPDGTVWRA
ncbi:MAG TPA: cysteine--tRNA ligase [Aggregatilineales bacterium]|jgi:cysteinyl-tRNA synthetase|nr:cysteine--tRNA ligase [Aggregatilineales bacterium]